MRRRTSDRSRPPLCSSPRFPHEHPMMAACPGRRVGRQEQGTTMTLINIRNLGVTLSAPLFSRLDLSVNAGDRIGLVAANGRGKSTLLRCIAGVAGPSDGEVTRSRGWTIAKAGREGPSATEDKR